MVVQVQKDATTALSYMVQLEEIKLRLLRAPDGLSSIFFMTRPVREVATLLGSHPLQGRASAARTCPFAPATAD